MRICSYTYVKIRSRSIKYYYYFLIILRKVVNPKEAICYVSIQTSGFWPRHVHQRRHSNYKINKKMRCVNCRNLNGSGLYDLRNWGRLCVLSNVIAIIFRLVLSFESWEIIQVKAEENGHGPSSLRYGKIDRPAVYILKRTENFVFGMVRKLIEKRDASVSIAFLSFSLPSRS